MATREYPISGAARPTIVKILRPSPEWITFERKPGEVYSTVRTTSREGKAWLIVSHKA